MKKAIFILIQIIFLNIGNSYSGIIYENEANSTLATAQLIQNESFSAGPNENIYNSTVDGWTWVSILGSGDGDNFSDELIIGEVDNGTFDYYSIYAVNGQRFIFDIDHVTSNSGGKSIEIGLWGNSGLLLAADDGSFQPDDEINASRNPYIDFTFATNGWYIVGVAPAIPAMPCSPAIA